MDSDRFDTLARALSRAVSRRGSVGILLGALAVLGEGVPGLAKDRQPKELVCHKGKTLAIAASAVQTHLAHGDRTGPCDAPGGTCPYSGCLTVCIQDAGCGEDFCYPTCEVCRSTSCCAEVCNADSWIRNLRCLTPARICG